MEFRTIVDIPESRWKIEPMERMLFVGSCFADNIGKRFADEHFRTVVNPYGVMYNPASILHTVKRLMDDDAMPFREDEQGTTVFTLGTNHVYILKETGEIVDNCRKRPQRLFEERELTIDECADYLRQAIECILSRYPKVRFILTVSPIRYRKYGYHGSQLSKATLLLAIDKLISSPNNQQPTPITYFPSYEIINDELRDYRFYKPDMLHPSDQAVDYIFERLADTYFSDATHSFIKEWEPIREALNHRPLHPESEEYQRFKHQTEERLRAFEQRFAKE
ncbi:MAG: GSCFA domain-containing protein [Prevotella sp.]